MSRRGLATTILFTLLLGANAFGQLSRELPRPPRIALVLSGGGARGLAHIGVLEILDSANIPIDLIVGTSMGSVVGGLYAAGYSTHELERITTETNWSDILSLDDDSHRSERLPGQKDEKTSLLALRFNGFFNPVLPVAISSGQRLTMLLNSLVLSSPYGTRDDFLHDLRVPFIALATDIVTGTRRMLTSGDLTSALRASATLPLRFSPLVTDSAVFVDGGLLANVPIDIARDSAHATYVIASNTTAELRQRNELNTPWDVADQVITLMMRRENAAQLKRADVIITPELEHTLPDNFLNATYYIELGRVAARAALPKLRALLASSETAEPVSAPDSEIIPVLREIRLHGINGSTRDSLQLLVNRVRGNRIGWHSLDAMILAPATEFLHRKGYSLARVDSAVIVSPKSRVDLYLDPGYISEIRINGLHTIKPIVVQNQLPFAAGDILQRRDCERALKNLTATGFFSFANMSFSEVGNGRPIVTMRMDTPIVSTRSVTVPTGTAIVMLNLEERATQVLRLGGLADNEFGTQFSMEYANENLLGLGGGFSLKGGLGPLSRYAELSIGGGPPLFRVEAAAYSTLRDITVYTFHDDIPHGTFTSSADDVVREIRDFGASAHVSLNIGRDASFAGEYHIERQRSYSLHTREYVSPAQLVAGLRGIVTYDSRDDEDYPHVGEFVEGFYEIGGHFLGGEVGYTKFGITLEEALPLSRLHNVLLKASLGVADRTTPRQDQFSLGGITSFFGLNEYELRGKQYVTGSVGYQIAIPNSLLFPTFVLFRYDLAGTWTEPTSIKFQSFIHGVGGEIGFKTPIGLARFGIGENFRFAQSMTNPLLLNTPRFYFSIGSNL
ncbi:MAG: patatin-like phospholipase family protein [Bacteroidetes bacterium]|nr:patatin-like phospholipase family protein [Bacteroidota bacterium]